ncbi:hypothetical protein CLV59_10795 [Chitinophaga dinghuensis]|uniref:Uncharacterized protein n=1 Tax=Chitinophaga dinghuensis TaxID=1539050 RepID=A0A327VTP7_9BACT|nr:hypothetical protein [Chitinophaga dinghuensis]RAJ77328.1 hypothetical protein CLV59_10795 [Chitinophaga dinghuensis]
MSNILSQEQKEELRRVFPHYDFSVEKEAAKLVDAGFDETEAQRLIVAEYRQYKKELFDELQAINRQAEIQKVVTMGVLFLAVTGPIFKIESMLWYVAAVIVAGAAGYWGYKPKPFAGVLACGIFTFVLPYAYKGYFSGRSSYIGIELFIPVIVALVPAIIIYFLIAKTVYGNVEND